MECELLKNLKSSTMITTEQYILILYTLYRTGYMKTIITEVEICIVHGVNNKSKKLTYI